MSDLLPMATYNLNVEPYSPTPAIDVTTPVTVRITIAAIDPEPLDDEKKPSTLRVIRRNPDFDDEDDILGGDFDEDELDNESESESESEPESKKNDSKDKKSKKAGKKADDEEEEEEDESEEGEEDDDEFEEFVLATLSPDTQYQQTLDLVIAPEEEVQFVVTGSYRVSLSGNYVKHPFDDPELYDDEDDDEELDDEDYEDDDEEEEEDSEADVQQIEEIEDASDVEAKVEEFIQKDKAKKEKRKLAEEPKPKEAKKAKKNEQPKEEKKEKKETEKKVEFKKDLEEGPSKKKDAKEKPKTKVLEGGIVIEDRVVGTGKIAKKSSRVGMRYIGKLKNGKVFDKNTSGKPFVFKLGHGEVIKGWDIGVAGMAVGGERRIVIPAPYAYGKQALPGIPANSELTFDVKLVSMK